MMASPDQPTNKRSSLNKWISGLRTSLLIVQCVVLLLMGWRMAPLSISWQTEDWSFSANDISAVLIDENNEPWFLVGKSIKNHQYELRHIANGELISWNLSSITFEEAQFASIAVGADGNPWLILGKRLAHWDGNQWIFSPMPFGSDIKDFSCQSVVVKGSTVWGIDNSAAQIRIIQLDIRTDSVQARVISLPDDLNSSPFSFDCIVSTKTGVLVALSNEKQVVFYELKDKGFRRITSFEKEQIAKSFINDMAVNSSGQIWVLFGFRNEGKQFGTYNPASDKWTWLDAKREKEFSAYEYDYGHLAVDTFDRVWVSAVQYGSERKLFSFSNVVADTIGVFKEGDDGLDEVQLYTSLNSSLYTSRVARIIVGSDGKIWTWGEQLVWLDGSQTSLPSTLPSWMAKLSSYNGLVGLTTLSITLLVVMIVLIALQRKTVSQKTS